MSRFEGQPPFDQYPERKTTVIDDFLAGHVVIGVAAKHVLSIAQTEDLIRAELVCRRERLRKAESDLQVVAEALARAKGVPRG